jgi:hypothetical protein
MTATRSQSLDEALPQTFAKVCRPTAASAPRRTA